MFFTEESMLYERFRDTKRSEITLYYCDIDKDLEPGVKYGPVIRDIYIIESCTGGYGSVIINEKEFQIKKGDVYFLMPGDTVVHTADTEEPRSGVWCAIDGIRLASVLKRAGIDSEHPFACAEAFEEITQQMLRIFDMKNESDPGADLRREGCIYAILGALMRGCASGDSDALIQKAIGYMEATYDGKVNVREVAQSVGLDRSYFSTLFKKITGCTPHMYLTLIRMRKAGALIRDGGYSVSEAAEAVGIDARNFGRVFKRVMGLTPLEYKKQ